MGSLEEQLLKNTITHSLQTIQGVLEAPTPLKPFELFMMYKTFMFGSNDGSRLKRNSNWPTGTNFNQFINILGISIITGFFTKAMFVFGSKFTEQDAPNLFGQMKRQTLTFVGIYSFGWLLTYFSGILKGIKTRMVKKPTEKKKNERSQFKKSNTDIENKNIGKIPVDKVNLKIGMTK